MKIKGQTFKAEPFVHEIVGLDGRGIEVTLTPLPPGFLDIQADVITFPVAPHKPLRNANGQLIKTNGQVQYGLDESNPKYLKALGHAKAAALAHTIETALANERDVSFETDRKDYPGDSSGFYYALHLEMVKDGFSVVEQNRMAEVVLQRSGMMMSVAEDEALDRFRGGDQQSERGRADHDGQDQG